MKYCVDCWHSYEEPDGILRCNFPPTVRLDPVYKRPMVKYCSVLRRDTDGCGPEARWWESKKKKR